MKFMVTWSIPQNNWLPLNKRFISMSPEERANVGEGVKLVGRWFNSAARTGIAILESDGLAAVSRYVGQWNAYLDVDIAPVLDEEEAVTVARQIVADNNA
jgi:Protein of unknown function (DUF3303)